MHDGILELTLRVARTPVAGLDLHLFLPQLCIDIASAVDAASALVVVLDPSGVHGSDDTAVLLGEAQHPAAVGPVANAIRSGQPLLTPDLRRVGPPVLAAVAAECGRVSSGVVPLCAGNRAIGGLQLLGPADRPVTSRQVEGLSPLPDVLAAFLANLAACILRRTPTTELPPPRTIRLPVVPQARSSSDDHTSAASWPARPATLHRRNAGT